MEKGNRLLMDICPCIDFFAGIGAWELASQIVNQFPGSQFETIQFIEINPSAQQVLKSQFPNIPIHSDVKNYQPIPGAAIVYFISFPCDGTSNAGKRTGLEHPESNLWYESLRCIILGRPKFVVVEQPEGFIHRGLRAVISGLHLAGYKTEIEIISAAELGAPHQRNRVFVIAYSNGATIESGKRWCCWAEQIRTHIAIARTIKTSSCPTIYSGKQQIKSPTLFVDDGVPEYLAGIAYSGWWQENSPPISPGIQTAFKRKSQRREMINLIGRSIVPLQAAIALLRVKFLLSLYASIPNTSD
jgi:DNA (cytosine-5)-methyltransferase 1